MADCLCRDALRGRRGEWANRRKGAQIIGRSGQTGRARCSAGRVRCTHYIHQVRALSPYRPFADTPSRLIIPPSSLHFPRRRFLFGGRLWRRGRFNNSGVQEFPRAVHHRCKIEFSVQISEIYCSHADNLQLSVGKPLCRLISWRSYFAQLCRWHTVSFRQIRLQGIDIIIEKPDHFHAGS